MMMKISAYPCIRFLNNTKTSITFVQRYHVICCYCTWLVRYLYFNDRTILHVITRHVVIFWPESMLNIRNNTGIRFCGHNRPLDIMLDVVMRCKSQVHVILSLSVCRLDRFQQARSKWWQLMPCGIVSTGNQEMHRSCNICRSFPVANITVGISTIWRLCSPPNRLFVHSVIQMYTKEQQSYSLLPLSGRFPSQRTSNVEYVPMPWRYQGETITGVITCANAVAICDTQIQLYVYVASKKTQHVMTNILFSSPRPFVPSI